MDENIIWKDRKRTIFGLPLSFTVYSLTSEVLYIKKGLFNINEDEIRLYRIMDITLHKSLGQRIFGVGSIRCCSADKTMGDFEIKSVKKPNFVKRKLSDLVEKERLAKRVLNREYMNHEEDHDDYDGEVDQ